MSSPTVRSVHNSSSSAASNQRSPDPVRVAPYLTHELAHHGQITLIPPQNAGRIRKTKSKKVDRSRTDRTRGDEEPRFNISVPSSTRRAQTTSSAGRTRRNGGTLPNSRGIGGVIEDLTVPNYPPPSFLEAISTPPFTPPSPSTAENERYPISAEFPRDNSPVLSTHAPSIGSQQMSSSSSSQLQTHPPNHKQLPPVRNGLPLNLPPPVVPVSPSEVAYSQPTIHVSRVHSPMNGGSTTPGAVPSPQSERITEPLVPFPSSTRHPPPSPLTLDINDAESDSSESPDCEEFVLEPSERWEADRRLGLPLKERVEREFTRKVAGESTLTLVPTPFSPSGPSKSFSTPPASSPQKRCCSRCGSVRPGTSPCLVDSDDDEDNNMGEEADAVLSSPRNMLRRGKQKASPNSTTSAPPSPLSSGPSSPMTSPSPWSSTFSLSLNTILSPIKSSPRSALRKDSFAVRRLFSPKGKEKGPEQPSTSDLTDPWDIIESADLPVTSVEDPRPPRSRDYLPLKTSSTAFLNRPLNRAVSPARSTLSAPGLTTPAPLASSETPSQSSSSKAVSPKSHDMRVDGTSSILPTEDNSKKVRRPPPPPPPPRKSANTLKASPSVIWLPHAAEISEPSTSNRDVHVISPTSYDSGHQCDGRLISPVHAFSTPTDSELSATASPSDAHSSRLDSEGPHAVSLHRMPAAHVHPTIQITKAQGIVNPSFEGNSTVSLSPTLPPSPPSSPPRSPATPTAGLHHYPGRPLPQPPHTPSPLSRRVPLAAPMLVEPSHLNTSDVPTPTSAYEDRTAPYSPYTDLDILLSRLEDGNQDGRNYDDMLLLSEIAGVVPPASDTRNVVDATLPYIGRIEVLRRRVVNGRVKLKLSLLGIVVDKCGVCLLQFKDAEMAALGPSCHHAFHEKCLQRWLIRSPTCPLCRTVFGAIDK